MKKPTVEEMETAIRVLHWIGDNLAEQNRHASLWNKLTGRYMDKECHDIASRIQTFINHKNQRAPKTEEDKP